MKRILTQLMQKKKIFETFIQVIQMCCRPSFHRTTIMYNLSRCLQFGDALKINNYNITITVIGSRNQTKLALTKTQSFLPLKTVNSNNHAVRNEYGL